jgi:uncharacterized protein
MDDALAAEQRLEGILRGYGAVAVAFSGGVDSTYLLDVAHGVLGDACIAVTADSPSLRRRRLGAAQAYCAARGIRHERLATAELTRSDYRENTGRRCHACKAELVDAIATRFPDVVICLGAVTDDFADVRPGLRAAAERGARWPLVDAGLDKATVRARSRARGLAGWDRPPEPCLGSRFPYGEPVTVAGLRMVEAAEDLLEDLGFSDGRARHHTVGGGRAWLCRIEVPVAEIPRAIELRTRLLAELRALGYAQVALDLGGLVSGGFNALLTPAEAAIGKVG